MKLSQILEAGELRKPERTPRQQIHRDDRAKMNKAYRDTTDKGEKEKFGKRLTPRQRSGGNTHAFDLKSIF